MTTNGTNETQCAIIDLGDHQKHIPGWRGIPETIVFNALIASIFILILTAIRLFYNRRKSNYNDWNISWVQFIYGDRPASLLFRPERIDRNQPHSYLPPELWPNANEPRRNNTPIVANQNAEERNRQQQYQKQLDRVGRHRFWLWDYLCIPLELIKEHRGDDAAHFLLCQLYLIYYLVVVSGICLLVLLPVNAAGGTMARDAFERTTINAIEGTSKLLYVHATVTTILVVLGVTTMKLYWNRLPLCNPSTDKRTIMVENIPKSKRKLKLLERYFQRCFRGVKVTRITFSYSVKQLNSLQDELQVIKEAVRYAECYQNENGKRLRVNPRCCDVCCCCCCCSGHESQDAIEYYKAEEEKAAKLVREETLKVRQRPEHVVFVQFETEQMTQRVLQHFEETMQLRTLKHDCSVLRQLFCCCLTGSQHEDPYGYNNWNAVAAPVPENIIWNDIIIYPCMAGLTAFLLSVLLIVAIVCFTTPLLIMNYIKTIFVAIGIKNSKPLDDPPFGSWGWFKWRLLDYFSLIFVSILDKVIPELAILIQKRVPRHTKSAKNNRLLQTSFFIFFLTAYIAPNIGLVSIELVVKSALSDHTNEAYHIYKCIFPTSSSSWFLKLVIVSTFLDISCDLLRLDGLLLYFLYCIIFPRTEAEYLRARQHSLPFIFNYVSNYTYDLLVFTIVITYAVACPLIAPAGLVYLLVKHGVDRYKIFYLCSVPDRIPFRMHQTVLTIVLIAYFFLLLQVTAFLTTQRTWKWSLDPAVALFGVLVLYCIFLFFGSWCLFGVNRPATRLSNDKMTPLRSFKRTTHRLSTSKKSGKTKTNTARSLQKKHGTTSKRKSNNATTTKRLTNSNK